MIKTGCWRYILLSRALAIESCRGSCGRSLNRREGGKVLSARSVRPSIAALLPEAVDHAMECQPAYKPTRSRILIRSTDFAPCRTQQIQPRPPFRKIELQGYCRDSDGGARAPRGLRGSRLLARKRPTDSGKQLPSSASIFFPCHLAKFL